MSVVNNPGIHPEKHSIPDLDAKYSICSIQQGKTCFVEKQVLYNLHFSSNNMYLFSISHNLILYNLKTFL